jgi:hypothetical protein
MATPSLAGFDLSTPRVMRVSEVSRFIKKFKDKEGTLIHIMRAKMKLVSKFLTMCK